MSQAIRALLIEDSEEDAQLIVRAMTRAGLSVDHTRVASEAELRTSLESESWDIVISDYAMPQFDGLTAAAIVRAHALELPFIFVSGAIGEERAVEAMRAGVRDYLEKDNLARLPGAVVREVENVRARQKARRDIARAERYAADIVASIAQPVVIADRDLRVVSSNPAFDEAAPGDEVEGDHDLLARLGACNGLAELESQLHRTLVDGTELRARDVTLGSSESRRHFLLNAQRILLADRAGAHLLVSMQDVTEHRLLERKMNAALRMEAVGLLAGGVAHDFNNILTVIDNYAYFLAQKVQGDERGEKDLKMIQDAAARATRLTQQLLAFSRKQSQDLQAVDVNEVVSEVAGLLSRVMGEHIRLETQLGEKLATVNADVTQLEQVIMNLAVNARDAMPQGGRLLIETASVQLDDHYAAIKDIELPQSEYVMVAVSDTGVGMDEATRTRVFEPFFTTKGPDRGTGLGLATVYGIVKQSGGYVWVYSEVGVGTTVKVYWPVPRELARGRNGSLNSLPAVASGNGSILLVEDDEGVRRAASRILRTAGYTVYEADDGERGLDAAQTAPQVNLVLTDVVMPNMTGGNLGRRLSEQRPDLPVVYMSGYTDAFIRELDEVPENAPYLPKPFTRRSLLAAVSVAMGWSPSQPPAAE